MQKFCQGGGGANLGYGACLHLLGGARMTQGGANAPPRPPLNTALLFIGGKGGASSPPTNCRDTDCLCMKARVYNILGGVSYSL